MWPPAGARSAPLRAAIYVVRGENIIRPPGRMSCVGRDGPYPFCLAVLDISP